MQYAGILAPIAFVFALSALSQISSLKKEVDELKEKIDKQYKNQI